MIKRIPFISYAILALVSTGLYMSHSAQAVIGVTGPAGPMNEVRITQMIVHYVPDGAIALGSIATQRQHLIQLVQKRTELTTRYMRTLASGAIVLALPYPISSQIALEYAAMIMRSDEIVYAEPDRRYWPMRIPDDEGFQFQWALQAPGDVPGAANLTNAWDFAVGNEKIVVSVLDTGVLNHADLASRFVGGSAAASGYDFIDDTNISNDGDGRDNDPTDPGDWAVVPECGGPSSSSWHGTHVAGILGAESNNTMGITGVDWKSKLITARVLGNCGGSLSDISDAISWSAGIPVGDITNPTPAHVINMSLGGESSCGISEQAVINTAVERGVVVVVAAGNSNQDVAKFAPASCDNVITVAALNPDGSRAGFSNFGELVDIAAPGVEIVSTLDSGTEGPNNDDIYVPYSGTSMATPMVSGVISLMLGSNPHLTDGTVSNVPALIEAKLKASARPFPTGTGNDCTTNTCGAGMLDAHRAIVSVSTAPVVNAGDDQSVAENDIVKLTAKAVDDDYNNGFRYQWRQTAGPTVTLSGATTSLTYFTAPNISADLVFSVTVTDDTGLSASDTVTVTNTGSLKPSKPVLKKQSGGGGSVDIWLLLLGGLIMMQYMMKSYLLTGVTYKRL